MSYNYPSDDPLTVMSSVRSTNVYEEQSLGVFEDDDESIDETQFQPSGSRASIWGKYLAMHMRRQLSFGTAFLSFRGKSES